MQKPRGHRVAAGQRFDARFVQPRAVVGFTRDDKPPTDECGDVIRDRAALVQLDGRERHVPRVVAQGVLQRIRKRAFAVGARAVEQEQHLLGRDARQGIANSALHEGDEFVLAVEDVPQEAFPARTWGGHDERRCRLQRQAVTGLPGREIPVRKSTTPEGVPSSQGFVFHRSPASAMGFMDLARASTFRRAPRRSSANVKRAIACRLADDAACTVSRCHSRAKANAIRDTASSASGRQRCASHSSQWARRWS